MKKIFKNGLLPVIILSLAVSLSACGGKEASSKDTEKVETATTMKKEEKAEKKKNKKKEKEEEKEEKEEEKKIDINDINIDWSRLTGYAFYGYVDYSEYGLDRLYANNYGYGFELLLMITIPDDMADLYYLDDETYRGHQHVNLLKNGEPITEVENVDYDIRNFLLGEEILAFRTSNRIVYRAIFSFDGSLNADNYSIQAPDGKEYTINWQFTDDINFLETELDIYKTVEGFMWLPSRDFAVKRQDELVWDLKGVYLYIPVEFEGMLSGTFDVRDATGRTGIDYAYLTRPSFFLDLDSSNERPWQLNLILPEEVDGKEVSEEEFFKELEEKGLYLYIMLDDSTTRLIEISKGSMYDEWYHND